MQFAFWRRLSPAHKARIVAGLTRMTNQLARAGIRLRHPNATAREVDLRLMALRVDRAVMIKSFGWDLEREGY
ncbi:MAG TPA: hypothetical protein VFT98_02415 [Myxococcota bacterium]|nr:hypothetical protein [Myxococcota bacterium]